MKIIRTLVLTALSVAATYAADVVPVFNATLTVGRESRFVLLGGDGKASHWLKVGETFEGYTVRAYDAKAAALDLEKDGRVTRVNLSADAAVGAGGVALDATPATIEDATALLDRMHFEAMIDRTMAVVKRQQGAMLDRMMGSKAGVDREAILAHQQKMMDVMLGAISGADIKNDVAKAYSEVFSKEELQGLASFYASPLGESFSDKQPALAEKMNQVMMPRIMAVMPKIQQMTQEFVAEQKAKQAGAAVKTGAPAPAAPPKQ